MIQAEDMFQFPANMKNGRPDILHSISVFLAALCILGMASCATKPKASPWQPVYVTDKSKYILLHPADIEVPLDMPQQITGNYGEKEFVMDAWVLADAQGINMMLLNSFGAGMGELDFREEAISFSSPFLPASIKPEYIIADFQFCFYRVDALASALKSCGLTLTTELRFTGNEGPVEVRIITDGKKNIIEIEKTKTAVRYRNRLRGYAYILGGQF
jgi:hypothetical protein